MGETKLITKLLGAAPEDAGAAAGGVVANTGSGQGIGGQAYDDASMIIGVLGPVGGAVSAAMDLAKIATSDEPVSQKVLDGTNAVLGAMGPLGAVAALGLELFESWLGGRMERKAQEKFMEENRCWFNDDGTERDDRNAGEKDENGNCKGIYVPPPPDPHIDSGAYKHDYHQTLDGMGSHIGFDPNKTGSKVGPNGPEKAAQTKVRVTDPYWDAHNYDGTVKPPTPSAMVAAMKLDPINNYAKIVKNYISKDNVFTTLGDRRNAEKMIGDYFKSTGLPAPDLRLFTDEQLYSIITGAKIKPHKATPLEMVRSMKLDRDYPRVVALYNQKWKSFGVNRPAAEKIVQFYLKLVGATTTDLRKYSDADLYTFMTGTAKKPQPQPQPQQKRPPPPPPQQEDPALTKENSLKKNKTIMSDPRAYDSNGQLINWTTQMKEVEKMAALMAGMANTQARIGASLAKKNKRR